MATSSRSRRKVYGGRREMTKGTRTFMVWTTAEENQPWESYGRPWIGTGFVYGLLLTRWIYLFSSCQDKGLDLGFD